MVIINHQAVVSTSLNIQNVTCAGSAKTNLFGIVAYFYIQTSATTGPRKKYYS